MATFTNTNKSSQVAFTIKTKATDVWTNQQRADVLGFGYDVQTFDNANTGFDDTGNTITTAWSVKNKEIG